MSGTSFVSIDHKLHPLGLLAIGIAVAASVLYGVLWSVSRRRRTVLATILEPYRLAPDVEGAAEAGPVLSSSVLGRLAGQVQSPVTGTRFGRWLDDLLERAGSTDPGGGAPHFMG